MDGKITFVRIKVYVNGGVVKPLPALGVIQTRFLVFVHYSSKVAIQRLSQTKAGLGDSILWPEHPGDPGKCSIISASS